MARTELQGYVARGKDKKDDYLTAFALNEWETQEWRQKIDTQKGERGCVWCGGMDGGIDMGCSPNGPAHPHHPYTSKQAPSWRRS